MIIPKVKVLEESDEKVSLQIEGIDHRSYANAIRRFCISEVPAMALDDIVILENSSVLYDEILAHRLGMIPLRTDLERYVLPEKCDCGNPLGCQKCRVLLVLDADRRLRPSPRTVLSGDPGLGGQGDQPGQPQHPDREAGRGAVGQARGICQAGKDKGARQSGSPPRSAGAARRQSPRARSY